MTFQTFVPDAVPFLLPCGTHCSNRACACWSTKVCQLHTTVVNAFITGTTTGTATVGVYPLGAPHTP